MDEAAFIKSIRSASEVRDKGDVKKLKSDFAKKEKRSADLDLLIKKVYEDNAMGKLPDRRYKMLSSDYEQEQQELEVSIKEIQEKLMQFEQPEEKTATRNMFYDEHGKHVRTKKEILDGDGNVRKGCKIIKKGEVYERKIFTIKDGRFKQESFLDEAKVFYTDLINQMVIDDKDRLSIFDKNGPYLATKKVGKNNPKAEKIKADNEIRMEWNRAAVALLERLIVKAMQKVRDFAEKVIDKADDTVKEMPKKVENHVHVKDESMVQAERKKIPFPVNPYWKADVQDKAEKPQQKSTAKVKKTVIEQIKVGQKTVPSETKSLETERPLQPKPSVLAGKYLCLKEIDSRLKEQNKAIVERERRRDKLKKELSECTGIFKGGKRKELQIEIGSMDTQISNMKKKLSSIVKEYRFDSVKAFYKGFNTAKREYLDYKAACAEWEKIYGKKVVNMGSLKDKLRQAKIISREREENRERQSKGTIRDGR